MNFMKRHYFIFTLIVIGWFPHITLKAQKEVQSPVEIFKSHWFVGANGGINWYFAEGNFFINESMYDPVFRENIGTQCILNLGYNFNPFFSLKAGLEFDKYNHAFKETTGFKYKKPFSGQKLNFDILINLTNLKKGYIKESRFNILAFGGLGAGFYGTNKIKSKYGFALRAGIQGDYKLTNQLALNLIADGNILTDNSNDFYADFPADFSFGLSMGLTYHFVQKTKPHLVEKDFEPLVDEVKSEVETPKLNMPIEPQVTIVDTLKQVTPIVEPVKPQVTVTDTSKQIASTVKPEIKQEPIETVYSTKEYIFFKINRRVIETPKQKEKIARLAEYLKQNPEIKVIITGYADNATGTEIINNIISRQRAKNVAYELKNKYNIDPSRLLVKWYGCKVQPFSEIWKNRVSVIETAE